MWEENGSVAVWINNELRAEYCGNLRQGGTGFMYKVGSYRHHMKQATDRGIEIQPVTVQYADIFKGKTCDKISATCSNLEELTGSTNASKMSHIVKCGGITVHAGDVFGLIKLDTKRKRAIIIVHLNER